MSPSRRVVFLGLCSMDAGLIREWAGRGVLPNLRALLADSALAPTRALPGLYVGATWPSFATGTHPGRHGVHCWEQIEPGSYRVSRCRPAERLRGEPFWHALGDAGRRVAILDVPHSQVTGPLNGIQMVEWGYHDVNHWFHTWPSELASEILAQHGPYPWRGLCDGDPLSRDFGAFRDALLRGIRIKTEISLDLLSRERWDLFAQVFTEAHCAGHQCWHLHDASYPTHDARTARRIGDPVRDVYVAIDAAVGEIRRRLPSDAVLVVHASHGMGPRYGASFFLEEVLLRLGASTLRARPPRRARDRLDPFLTASWRSLPWALRGRLPGARRAMRRWIDGHARRRTRVDPARSLCFPVENNLPHAGIRVNLRGREPRGRVEPGREYARLLDELARELERLVDPSSGRPVVDRVVRTDALYPGECRDALPDLMVEWSRIPGLDAVASPRIGVVREDQRWYGRSGEHVAHGLLAATGPGVPRGPIRGEFSTLDVAPTLCALLGERLRDVDGAPIGAICAP